MNIISACLQIDAAGARITDRYGTETTVTLPLGAAVRLDLDLRGAPDPETGVLQPCSSVVSELSSAVCYFALDRDFDRRSEPLLLQTEGVFVSAGGSGSAAIFSVPIPNTGVAPLVSALAGSSAAEFHAEIGAVASGGETVFAHQFAVAVRNRVYLGGDAPDSVAGDPAYLTAAETRAVISSAVPQRIGEVLPEAVAQQVEDTISSGGYATSSAVGAIVSSGGYATSSAAASIAGSAIASFGSGIDYVVATGNNGSSTLEDYQWYRKYKSGWLEQGGLCTGTTSSGKTVTLLQPFADNKYTVVGTMHTQNTITAERVCVINNQGKETTSFSLRTGGGGWCYWYAAGQGVVSNS